MVSNVQFCALVAVAFLVCLLTFLKVNNMQVKKNQKKQRPAKKLKQVQKRSLGCTDKVNNDGNQWVGDGVTINSQTDVTKSCTDTMCDDGWEIYVEPGAGSYFVSLSKTKPNCGYFSIVSGTRVHRYNLLGQSAIPIPAPGRRIVANAAVRIIGGTHEDKTGTFLHSTEHRHRINIHGGVGARSILHKNVEVVDDARVQVVPAVWTSAHFRFQNEYPQLVVVVVRVVSYRSSSSTTTNNNKNNVKM